MTTTCLFSIDRRLLRSENRTGGGGHHVKTELTSSVISGFLIVLLLFQVGFREGAVAKTRFCMKDAVKASLRPLFSWHQK